MNVRLDMPPMTSGTDREQLSAVRDYLFVMARRLNAAFASLAGAASAAPADAPVLTAVNDSALPVSADDINALKSRIVSAAAAVEREIETVETQMRSQYVARSDYGTFAETVTASLAASAGSFSALYDYYSALSASVAAAGAGFDGYVSRTSASIRAGIVGWEGSTPVFGVAVGQGITATTVTVDGTEYDEIDRGRFLSVFTAKKLSFRQNGTEVAYLGGERLHITAAHISDRLEIGSGWLVTPLGGLTVKWTGRAMPLMLSARPGGWVDVPDGKENEESGEP